MKMPEVRLSRVLESIVDGPFGSSLASQHYTDEGARVVRLGNIGMGQFKDDKRAYISLSHYATLQRHQVVPGDVLIAGLGDEQNSLGRACLAPDLGPAIVKADCFRARFHSDQIEPRFIVHFLCSALGAWRIEQNSRGATRSRATPDAVAAVRVPVPPLEEQRRIANFLDDQVALLDRAVALRQEQAALTSESHAARLDVLLRQGERRTSELVPAEYGPFGTIPKAWRQGRLRSTRVDVQTGPFGSQLNAAEYVDGGWPVVNPSNITKEGELVADDTVTVDDCTRERLARHVLCVGDVVFGRRGDLGRAGLVTEDQSGWLCGTGSLRVRFKEAAFEPSYLTRFLRLPSVRYYFESNSVGSTMQNLNTSLLLGVPLLMPSIGEQQEIAKAADDLADRHARLTALLTGSIGLLEERKKALITAAVSGEFDVTTARKVLTSV